MHLKVHVQSKMGYRDELIHVFNAHRKPWLRKQKFLLLLILTTVGVAIVMFATGHQVPNMVHVMAMPGLGMNRNSNKEPPPPDRKVDVIYADGQLAESRDKESPLNNDGMVESRNKEAPLDNDGMMESSYKEAPLGNDGMMENQSRYKPRDDDVYKSETHPNDIYSFCGTKFSQSMDILGLEHVHGLPEFKNPCWYEDSNFRCFPYFFVIGAPKTGTSDLYNRLLEHPQFVRPAEKEPNWFSQKLFSQKMTFSQYVTKVFGQAALTIRKNFNATGVPYSKLITGDCSTTYYHYHDFWSIMPGNRNKTEPVYTNSDYIHHFNPKAKIILSVRHPIDRAWSGYLYSSRGAKSAQTFHNAVVKATQTYLDCFKVRTVRSCVYDKKLYLKSTGVHVPDDPNWRCPLDSMNFQVNINLRLSMYSVFLKDYMKVFPREQVLVQRLEDRSEDMAASMRELYQFLEMDQLPEETMKKMVSLENINVRNSQNLRVGEMMEETRKILYDFFKPFNEELARLAGDQKFNYGLT